MNILLVNDDGFGYEGIELLKNKLAKYGTVYIVAPLYPQSGKSGSFTYLSGLKVKKIDKYNYIVDGTPVDCVSFATTVIKIKFDLIVSGCNDGNNLSYDCFYSGTIGACKEGLVHNIPSLAFSCDRGCYNIVREYFDDVFSYILDKHLLSKDYFLNVNFPSKKFNHIKGIKLAKLYIRQDQFFYEYKDNLYYLDRIEDTNTLDQNTDIYLVNHGYVSIVPQRMTSFEESLYFELINKK